MGVWKTIDIDFWQDLLSFIRKLKERESEWWVLSKKYIMI